jgi:hypothetical protein
MRTLFPYTTLFRSPRDHIRKLAKKRKTSNVSHLSAVHPFLPTRRGTEIIELNMLNGGLLLDIGLPQA